MCGIGGVLRRDGQGPVAFAELRRMAAALRHRGPDGYGLYRDPRVGLCHTRLSIVDLRGGAQPMHNEDQSIWVVFNGEIFDHVELRAELEACGHRFYTRSDTEVIVHAYEQWGVDAFRRFNGQFAIALWDSRTRQLWLVRDRIGILPLFFANDGRVASFGSEQKALFATGQLPVQFDAASIGRVFTLWAEPGPASVFAGVRTVMPGTAVCIDAELNERVLSWWQPDFTSEGPRPLDDAADELGQLLDRAIRLRLRADVPVGAYVSGGLDSSVIADRARQAAIGNLQTFSLRFVDPDYDETAEQRRMVARLGTQHHEIVCDASDIRAALPEVIWQCETPLLRTGPVPMFLLSQLVRDSGMKVVLTGEGADEFLAGYSIFKEDKVRRFWARQPDSAARPRLLSRVHSYIAAADQRSTAMWQEFYRGDLGATAAPFYSHAVRWQNTAFAVRCLSAEVRQQLSHDAAMAAVEAIMPVGWRQWRPLGRSQAIEIATFMSPYLLSSQGDRVAMGHGVEVRYPFLDPAVIDFCCRLPDGCKRRGLRDKLALRRLAARHLPTDVAARPKHPYRAPTTTALFAPGVDDYVQALLTPAALARTGLVDVGLARRLVDKAVQRNGRMAGEREAMALVGLLTLQLLAEQFQTRLPARIDQLAEQLERTAPDVYEDHSMKASSPPGT